MTFTIMPPVVTVRRKLQKHAELNYLACLMLTIILTPSPILIVSRPIIPGVLKFMEMLQLAVLT